MYKPKYKLPPDFKINEDPNCPCYFYYYNQNNPKEISRLYNNLKILLENCNRYVNKINQITISKLPIGFWISLEIDTELAKLWYNDNVVTSSSDIESLVLLANKNGPIYEAVNRLNNGQEIEL